MNRKTLKQNYENACIAYIQAFCDKHGYDCDYTDIDLICIGDLFVDMVTIRTDIDMDAKSALALMK